MGHRYIDSVITGHERLVFLGQFPWLYKLQAWSALAFGLIAFFLILVAGLQADGAHNLGALLDPNNIRVAIIENGGVLNAIRNSNIVFRIFAFVALLIGVTIFSSMLVTMLTTEIGVTSYRLIYKTGLIARQVGEMNLNRIESVHVGQTILGRLLNFGQVEVRGMGVGDIGLPALHDPLSLRRAIEVVIRDRTRNEGSRP